MIFDHFNSAEKFYSLHEGFKKSFDFLRSDNLAHLPVGTYEIDGNNIFAIVSDKQGKKTSEAKLEAHRAYIDIQYLVAGEEKIGWKPYSACNDVSSAFNHDKDIEFFEDAPQTYFSLLPGNFGIFYPEDGHAPMVSDGNVKKVVIKVKI